MSIVLLLILSSIMIWILRIFMPVRQLTFVDVSILKEPSDKVKTMKMLDVRDAVDFEQCHVEGSINISLGRLPFVWEKELSSGDSVLILSKSRYQSKKAARILKNHGFHSLYAMNERYCA
ncbi:rhodanese-like domain-containing protein [Paenibacillus segetis]|uniref:Rhodanese domain-containing protein n=1 Tax=Paenibacillus segetis TaxID=1325360 RepID=A0ABQ1YDY4_9BACL|nr:rhodanese-like domain-containing protein [Paenibacillus segetis]GGH21864.1 hypothetical protein GCM10008013_20000 [Paenibacillus segetis]